MEIENVTAIITGAASGMGEAVSRRLSKKGAKVALLDINEEKIKPLAKELKGIAIACDVTSHASVNSAIESIVAQIGPPRICINCAGILHTRRIINKQGVMPLEEFEQTISVNLVGTFNVMRLAAAAMMQLPPLIDDERGIIINTASIAAFDGQIGQVAYSASKGGIVGLTLPAARELASLGIRVMAVAPGLVDTPMFAKISTEAKNSLAASVPFPKRLTNPDEFAFLIEHIIQNRMINGEVIRLDGALRMAPK